eukprot:2444531-Rhodomonas_salina.2
MTANAHAPCRQGPRLARIGAERHLPRITIALHVHRTPHYRRGCTLILRASERASESKSEGARAYRAIALANAARVDLRCPERISLQDTRAGFRAQGAGLKGFGTALRCARGLVRLRRVLVKVGVEGNTGRHPAVGLDFAGDEDGQVRRGALHLAPEHTRVNTASTRMRPHRTKHLIPQHTRLNTGQQHTRFNTAPQQHTCLNTKQSAKHTRIGRSVALTHEPLGLDPTRSLRIPSLDHSARVASQKRHDTAVRSPVTRSMTAPSPISGRSVESYGRRIVVS